MSLAELFKSLAGRVVRLFSFSFIDMWLTNKNLSIFCILKVYNLMYWYTYTLWNDHHNKVINIFITSSKSYLFLKFLMRPAMIYSLSKSQVEKYTIGNYCQYTAHYISRTYSSCIIGTLYLLAKFSSATTILLCVSMSSTILVSTYKSGLFHLS